MKWIFLVIVLAILAYMTYVLFTTDKNVELFDALEDEEDFGVADETDFQHKLDD